MHTIQRTKRQLAHTVDNKCTDNASATSPRTIFVQFGEGYADRDPAIDQTTLQQQLYGYDKPQQSAKYSAFMAGGKKT